MFQNLYTYRNDLIRIGHHSDEHVKKYNYVDDRIRPEHEESPKPGESFNSCQFKIGQVNKTKASPEK